MAKQVSDMDQQLRDARRVELVIAIMRNRVKRNACVFFGIVALGLILFFGWSKWMMLIPAVLGIGVFLYQMNMFIISAEIKRRSEESESGGGSGMGAPN